MMRLAKVSKYMDAEAVRCTIYMYHDATDEAVRIGEAQMVKRGNGTHSTLPLRKYRQSNTV